MGEHDRSIWWTRRALGLHLTLGVCIPGFVAAFIWQVDRVRQGNTLSWAYVFEWPFFTGYAIYLWWHLVHDQPGLEVSRSTKRVEPLDDEAAQRELDAYNRYLASLDHDDNV